MKLTLFFLRGKNSDHFKYVLRDSIFRLVNFFRKRTSQVNTPYPAMVIECICVIGNNMKF